MRTLILSFLCFIAVATCKAQPQVVKNPIIPGYHPDPSIVRVDNDYYLVNSSFQFFPGVPLFHSRDLVHWQQVGNVLNRPEQLPLKGANCWLGIYAPTIRYYEGTYYMITTNVGNGGNFLVYTDDIASNQWSNPVWLEQQGIDPSLYFEKDAEGNTHCFMVSNPEDAIWLCEIEPKSGKTITPSRKIWSGTGGRYPEAPHIYKRGDYYYLMIAEGGTEMGHSETIARSHCIEGPYEACPHNPILYHQKQLTQSSTIQATGHADLVETADGKWYMVCLAFRPMINNMHNLGRETFITPVEWDDNGWPVVNNTATVPESFFVDTTPDTDLIQNEGTTPYFISSGVCDVHGWNKQQRRLGPEWMFLNNPDMSSYELSNGLLTITPSTPTIENDGATCSFASRRMEHINFSASTEIMLKKAAPSDEAGMTIYMNGNSHYDLLLKCDEKGNAHLVLRYRLGNILYTAKEVNLNEGLGTKKPLHITISGDVSNYHFSYNDNEGKTVDLGVMDTRYLSSETAGGFTGLVLGLFATSEAQHPGKAVFSNFVYSGLTNTVLDGNTR